MNSMNTIKELFPNTFAEKRPAYLLIFKDADGTVYDAFNFYTLEAAQKQKDLTPIINASVHAEIRAI